MPRIKIEDREYGLGNDVEALPEDPKGYGLREVRGPEMDKLRGMLSGFGFELVTQRTVLDVYVLEGDGRRRVTFGGRPVRVIALDTVLRDMPGTVAEPQPENGTVPEPAPAPVPELELVPEDETQTGEIPALEQPAHVDEPTPELHDEAQAPIEPKPEGD